MDTESRLSDLLSEFERVTDFPIQFIPDHILVRIVGLLPIGSAGIPLIPPSGGSRHVTASDAAQHRTRRVHRPSGVPRDA